MPSTSHPTNIGYVPTGIAGNFINESTFVVGRELASDFEGIGFGKAGRPDELQRMIVNLTWAATTSQPAAQMGQVKLDITDLKAIIDSNSNAPRLMTFTLKEVDVCENGTAKKMVILASDTYTP